MKITAETNQELIAAAGSRYDGVCKVLGIEVERPASDPYAQAEAQANATNAGQPGDGATVGQDDPNVDDQPPATEATAATETNIETTGEAATGDASGSTETTNAQTEGAGA